MSRKVPEEQYKKTRSYHLRQWLDGTKDPFLDTVEMKPQQEFKEDTTVTRQRSEEKKKIYERVFVWSTMLEMRLFQKIYRLSAYCSVSVWCSFCSPESLICRHLVMRKIR